jgi:hypothetical protein
MTDERKIKLFDEAITWVWEHTEEYGMKAYVSALKEIGYTPEEITEELFSCNFDDEHDDDECPLGGDISNDCTDCAYACDYHFVDGECIRREK